MGLDQALAAGQALVAGQRSALANDNIINMVVSQSHGKVQQSDTQYVWHYVYQLDHQLSELRSQVRSQHPFSSAFRGVTLVL